jgi:hypothetical protein
MKKVVFVNGGAGRVISSVPALEELERRGELAAIVCEGGMEVFLGHPTLQNRAFDVNHKGMFELIKDCEVITPEPYRDYEYYNQRSSIQQSFWYQIVGERTTETKRPTFMLAKTEEIPAVDIIGQARGKGQKEKTIVIQPFGRSSMTGPGVVVDGSTRSMEQDTFMAIVKDLTKDYNMIYMGEHKIDTGDTTLLQLEQNPPLRIWAAVIEAADYFLGCDSVGQHFAYAFNKPGSVILGSTYAVNVSYPDHFNIIEKKDFEKTYSPIRLLGFGSEEADRLNDRAMTFDSKETKEIISNIRAHIKKTIG